MKFIELGKHLAARELKSAYFVTGDDPFIVRSALSLFSSLVSGFKELNYTTFAAGATHAEIVPALGTPPMLAEYRIVCVEGFTGDTQWLKRYLTEPCPTTVLIFTGALTPNFTALLAHIEVVDCNRLDERYLSSWIVKKAATMRTVVEPTAAALLAQYCNRDMNRVMGELNKLVDYAAGQTVTTDTVKELVSPDLEFKIFELAEAIATKNADRAIVMTDKLLSENNAPISLLSMLFNHFRRLLMVSLNPESTTLVSDLKVKEYAVKVAIRQAKAFSPRRLKAIFDKLCEADAAIKGGRIVDRNALHTFVCETVLIG